MTDTKRTVTKLRKKLRALKDHRNRLEVDKQMLEGDVLLKDLHVRQLERDNILLDSERVAQSELLDHVRGIIGQPFALQRPSALTPEESSQLMLGKLMQLRFTLGMSTEFEFRRVTGDDESAG